jgi:hypothetical protein
MEVVHLQNSLIDSHNLLKRRDFLLESLSDPMHIGHIFEVVVLQNLARVTASHEG